MARLEQNQVMVNKNFEQLHTEIHDLKTMLAKVTDEAAKRGKVPE